MAQVQQRLLVAAVLLPALCIAKKFFDDDPIASMPKPIRVEKAKPRSLNEYFEFFSSTFSHNVKQTSMEPVAAQNVNTLDEVVDTAWYENRHVRHHLTEEALRRGPGDRNPPSGDAWKVIAAKHEGETPGFTIEDQTGARYVLKLDPPDNPEMASAADVIGSKFFYALGYHVPENYVVHFERKQLTVVPNTTLVDAKGRKWPISGRRLDEILRYAKRDREGRFRAMASRFVDGDLLGPFRYNGVRRDDPNDVVPHEHRRELRGLYVFAAWLGHTDITSLNTLDALVEENGSRFVKHHLIDFGSTLGSGGTRPKTPRGGNQYEFQFRPAAAQLLSLGLYVPAWMRVRYPEMPSVGRFESAAFDPLRWKPSYPNLAFEHRQPADDFWAARQVMEFTDQNILTLVRTGQLTDRSAEQHLVRTLSERRDKIGRAFFSSTLPLDRFKLNEGFLDFEDLAVDQGFASARPYRVRWWAFDNESARKLLPEESAQVIDGTRAPLPMKLNGADIRTFFVASLQLADSNESKPGVSVYLRKNAANIIDIVGIERR